jgi:hypothetical protein
MGAGATGAAAMGAAATGIAATLLLKLLMPSQYSMLDHGRMHWYDRNNFSISSHVFNESQDRIISSATITG